MKTIVFMDEVTPPAKVEVFEPDYPFGGVIVEEPGAPMPQVEVVNPDSPFSGVLVYPPAPETGSPTVEIVNPDYPFEGVLVEMPPETPLQVELNSGSPVTSVFGRIGSIMPMCEDYAFCYAPIQAGVPKGGSTGLVLAKASDADYDLRWQPSATFSSNLVVGEIPGEAVNSVNAVFSTGNPYAPNSLCVYLNGVRQRRNEDYVETGPQTFQFLSPPPSGSSVSIDYTIPS